jgi:urease accessory protein UreH
MPRPTSVATVRVRDRFVEPCDRRAPSAVGRQARLELTFARRRGRTVLAEAYAEPPFHVGRTFPEGDGLHLILASSAPGVFGGDCFRQTIRVERGACVRLTSQSAQQVHPVPGAVPTRLVTTCLVEDEAALWCEWHPLIPFAGAELDQRIDVHIGGSGCLYWSDALMAGRLAGGERWRFSSLAHELSVTREDCLEYLERYRIDPRERDVTRRWMAGDATYFGTVLLSGWPLDPELAHRLQGELASVDGLQAAVDQLDQRLLLVRYKGSDLVSCASAPFVGRAFRPH